MPASAAVAAAAAAAVAAGGLGGLSGVGGVGGASDGLLNVSGSNFSPDPEIGALCTFSRFGGTLGATPASYASPTQLRCASPALLPDDAGAAALTLTALVHGAPATADYGRVVDTLPFTFFDGALPPLISRISPQGVPLETHTQVPLSVLVHGSNFAPDLLSCDIDGVSTAATFLRASLVRCATPLDPPDAPASLELRVVRGGSLVGGMRVGGLASGPLPFSFFDAGAVPSTAAATPAHASVHGGSQVLVTGDGYRPAGAALQCRVGGVAVPAVFVSVTSAS